VQIMNNIKRVAAGIIAGAAITVAPVVAFAAPAFAVTGISGSGGLHIPSEQHVQVDQASSGIMAQHMRVVRDDSDPLEDLPHTKEWPASSASAGQSDASRALVNAASSGSLRDGNAARCGGGINC